MEVPLLRDHSPDAVTSSGGYTFDDSKSLSYATILDSVTGIGDSAFADCRSLSSATVPDSVASVGTTLSTAASPSPS